MRYLIIGQYGRDACCVLNEFDSFLTAIKYKRELKKRLAKNWKLRILDTNYGPF